MHRLDTKSKYFSYIDLDVAVRISYIIVNLRASLV